MGLFGKSKEDTSQDQQIVNIWKWIEQLNKNQGILIKNNDVFVANEKNQRSLNAEYSKAINSLVAKDKIHDAKDAEHDRLFQALKTVTADATTTEG